MSGSQKHFNTSKRLKVQNRECFYFNVDSNPPLIVFLKCLLFGLDSNDVVQTSGWTTFFNVSFFKEFIGQNKTLTLYDVGSSAKLTTNKRKCLSFVKWSNNYSYLHSGLSCFSCLHLEPLHENVLRYGWTLSLYHQHQHQHRHRDHHHGKLRFSMVNINL